MLKEKTKVKGIQQTKEQKYKKKVEHDDKNL